MTVDLENYCQCSWTIAETGSACAMCRIEQYLDAEYTKNVLEMADGEGDYDGSLDD